MEVVAMGAGEVGRGRASSLMSLAVADVFADAAGTALLLESN
jgi:hypothetical protein